MGQGNREFDMEIVKIFARKMSPYSKGMYVKLSNGKKGMVYDTIKNYPLRPVVKLFENDKVISLIKDNSLTVKKLYIEKKCLGGYMKKRSIMTFHSTHDALSFESLLKENDLEIKIIPVPREISASCGLAARFNYDKLEEVMKLSADKLEFSEVFLKKENEYEKIK